MFYCGLSYHVKARDGNVKLLIGAGVVLITFTNIRISEINLQAPFN
jgi:hypothetical protein